MIMPNLFADEGMWLPLLLKNKEADMQKNGMRISAEDIYSVNNSSLKDAVVHFGGGCTGEIISNEGLLITNHHCGYGQIQQHSSVEHDYLTNGFWAMTRDQELPNPGLTVSFLDYMEDVTEQVMKGYKKGMSEEKRVALVEKNIMKIIEKAKESNVPIHQDSKLAGTLSKLEIGDMIPPELYEAVAEVLIFVDAMEKIKSKM